MNLFFFLIVAVLFNPKISLADIKNELLNDSMVWNDESGKESRLSQWQNKNVIITMSYTNCKKICPMLTIATLKKLQKKLDLAHKNTEFVIITFDPEFDTTQILKSYKEKIGMDLANWHFLRGSIENTKAIAKKLDLDGFWKLDNHIIHDFKILIIGTDGKVEATLDWNNRDADAALVKLKDPSP